MSLAEQRLLEERKRFRKDRPFGFVAKPVSRPDGSVNMKKWDCLIPGPENSSWEGGCYPLTMEFPDTYPAAPPICRFPANFWHVNVYPDGQVCLSILNDDDEMGGTWAPSITIKQVLLGIQELLVTPNLNSAAQQHAYDALHRDKAVYERRIREQAAKYPPPKDTD